MCCQNARKDQENTPPAHNYPKGAIHRCRLEYIEEYEDKTELFQLLSAIVRGIEAVEQGDRISHEEAMRRLDTRVRE